MSHHRQPPIVLAKYSVWKVGLWGCIFLVIFGSILPDGGTHWATLTGMDFLIYVAAVFMAVVGLGLLARLVLSRGAAILIDQSHLVLNFPFGRKTIPLADAISVHLEQKKVGAARLGIMTSLSMVEQVTIAHAGGPDVPFRTGLLSETGSTITDRIKFHLH